MSEKREVIQIITATPGHYLLWFWPHEGREAAGVTREPIVAWAHIRCDGADELEPVTVDQFGLPSMPDYDCAVLHPDGSVITPGDQSWGSETEWRRTKEAWHKEARAKEALARAARAP